MVSQAGGSLTAPSESTEAMLPSIADLTDNQARDVARTAELFSGQAVSGPAPAMTGWLIGRIVGAAPITEDALPQFGALR
jgi:hypothetical protein